MSLQSVRDDLDVSRSKIIYSDCFITRNDSIIISKANTDVTVRFHAATGSRNTYMIKNDSMYILTVLFDAEDVMDTDISLVEIFPYESYLILDNAPYNWAMLDFHILWFFGGFPPKLLL